MSTITLTNDDGTIEVFVPQPAVAVDAPVETPVVDVPAEEVAPTEEVEVVSDAVEPEAA